MEPYRLHYAPDNASLCVRLALLALDVPFDAALVDRSTQAQDSAAYRRLHPAGLIPALETPEGPVFETAAILLWLADRHGRLAPAPHDPGRGKVTSWLFWLANTLHPSLLMLFYPERYVDPAGQAAFAARTQARISAHLDLLEAGLPDLAGWLGGPQPSILDCYLCPMLRWMALYPEDGTAWFVLARWPGLLAVVQAMDAHPIGALAAEAEGLGPTAFSAPEISAPQTANPPEESAT